MSSIKKSTTLREDFQVQPAQRTLKKVNIQASEECKDRLSYAARTIQTAYRHYRRTKEVERNFKYLSDNGIEYPSEWHAPSV